MSRRRYLSTEISTDTAVNRLARSGGDFAVILYTWMIPHCDDDGIVHGDAEEIILKVIPGRRDKSTVDVTNALRAMQELSLVEWDEEGRRVIFPASSFYKYQTYIKDDRRRGETSAENNNAPEGAQDGEEQQPTPQNTADQRKTPQNTVSVKHSLSHPVKHSHPEGERERASGAHAVNGAHPPARAAPAHPALIVLPDPFVNDTPEIEAWVREQKMPFAWVNNRTDSFVAHYRESGTMLTAERWMERFKKWLLDDWVKERSSGLTTRR